MNCAAIDVEKVADDDGVSAGDQIGFTVTLTNTGEGEAKGISFTDVLPAGLSWSISPASRRLVDPGPEPGLRPHDPRGGREHLGARDRHHRRG